MNRIIKIHKQPSDTFRLGMLLSMTGGFVDAYTFILRGRVLANAQTGNIVFFGLRLIEKKMGRSTFLFHTDFLFCNRSIDCWIYKSQIQQIQNSLETDYYSHRNFYLVYLCLYSYGKFRCFCKHCYFIYLFSSSTGFQKN